MNRVQFTLFSTQTIPIIKAMQHFQGRLNVRAAQIVDIFSTKICKTKRIYMSLLNSIMDRSFNKNKTHIACINEKENGWNYELSSPIACAYLSTLGVFVSPCYESHLYRWKLWIYMCVYFSIMNSTIAEEHYSWLHSIWFSLILARNIKLFAEYICFLA